MCGIAFAISKFPVKGFIEEAGSIQVHRGPDNQNFSLYQFGEFYVGMGHQRLSILDLSEKGSQPMRSRSGRYEMVFNGEIYNYREIQKKYNIQGLRSGTDSEVAIELIEKIGIARASQEFNGMWSIIALDHCNGEILISRDRFGKKPLYYMQRDEEIFFSSEARTLLAVSDVKPEPDPVVATRFLTQSLQNIDQRSWFKGIKAFPPSCTGSMPVHKPYLDDCKLARFWTPDFSHDMSFCEDSEGVDQLDYLLNDAVSIRLHSDVPVGVALSGGIDSSIIASIASRHTSDVSFFSSVHPGSKDDESSYIDEASNYFGIKVDKISLGALDAKGLFDVLSVCNNYNDGPVVSFSNVLFYRLMQAAYEKGVKVVLTGQGADEVFCGYRKYPILNIKKQMKDKKWLLSSLLLIQVLMSRTVLSGFKFSEAKRYLGVKNDSILGEAAKGEEMAYRLGEITNMPERQWADLSSLSVPYLCHYEDRMSMAWSREIRSPFLDYRLVEFGLKLPTYLKINKGWTKYILREAFKNKIPHSIAWRRDKKGFVNPQDDWLSGPLKEYVMAIMGDPGSYIYVYELVDRKAYLKLFERYCSGDRRVWFRDVFSPFSLAVWLQGINERPVV
ncbi:asparagine synthase (glutamine-hydrolyzing) [Alloalcanivorax xenomutans]